MKQVVMLSLVLALGCERGGLRPIAGELQVSARSVDFGQAFLGTGVERSAVVQNRSRGARTLSISSTGPFSTAGGQVVVPGGSEVAISLRFAPSEPGEAAGTLAIGDATEAFEISLVGMGVEVPRCEASGPCQLDVFDPALGACAVSQAADGTACSDACTTAGLCSAGTCLGLALDCGDGDLCTVDACDSSSGCIHPPQACAAPSDPCKAARCDPARGCVESDVRDGTSCGVADCATAQVCLQGECKAVPVPDGATCAEATPCQGAGTCQQGQCARPAATELVEAWSYAFPGQKVAFRGVTDAFQNLYWLECPAVGPCSATSYTRDGVLRFRTPLSQVGLTPSALTYLLAGDELISANGSAIEAVAISNGALRWSYALPSAFPGAPDLADVQAIVAIASDQTGLTVIVGRSLGQQASRQSLVLKLALGTRATVFSRFYDAQVDGLVMDESSNLYFTLVPWYQPATPTRPNTLVSLRAATGAERWRWVAPAATPSAVAGPIAVFNGELILEGGEVRSTRDGTVRAAPPLGYVHDNPLMGPSARMLVRRPPSDDRLEVIAMGPGVATPAWEALVTTLHGSNAITETLATLGGGVLVASGGSRQPNVLKSFSGLGVERFACLIAGNVPWGAVVNQPVAMLDGRWAVVESASIIARLHVFEVPGELPATRGWPRKNGSPSGNPRPVP